jgi:septal ring factor EnvC (AmiA/AmiB activator)
MKLFKNKSKLTTATGGDSWVAIEQELQMQIETARARIERLTEQRSERTLKAKTGDGEAQKQIDMLAEELVRLSRDVTDLEIARAKASDKIKSEEADLAQRAATERAAAVRVAARAVLNSDIEVDAAMERLVKAFADRKVSLNSLHGVAGPLPNRLYDPMVGLRAARFFGLHQYVALEHANTIHQRSLTDADRSLLVALGSDPVSQQDESQRSVVVAG